LKLKSLFIFALETVNEMLESYASFYDLVPKKEEFKIVKNPYLCNKSLIEQKVVV